jgi:hypothetical protein
VYVPTADVGEALTCCVDLPCASGALVHRQRPSDDSNQARTRMRVEAMEIPADEYSGARPRPAGLPASLAESAACTGLGQLHRKRESEHHVTGCDASCSRLHL